MPKSIKIHPKIIQIYQNGPQERPEKQLGSKLAQECARETKLTCFFITTWRILGAIFGPVGRQGAPKIKNFGTKSM